MWKAKKSIVIQTREFIIIQFNTVLWRISLTRWNINETPYSDTSFNEQPENANTFHTRHESVVDLHIPCWWQNEISQ